MSHRHMLCACLISIIFSFISCGGQTEITRSDLSGKKTGDAISKRKKTSSDIDPDNRKKKKKTKVTDDDSKKEGASGSEKNSAESEDGDSTNGPAEVDYPQLGFRGNGYTTYKLKDKMVMKVDLETLLDEDQLSVNTTSAKVECGDKNGCEQDDVDKSVNATSLGANVYNRITKSEAKTLKNADYSLPAYAIFSKSVRGKNGISYTFSKPLPVYPWPGSKSRYEELGMSPESWTITATADRYVPTTGDISIQKAQDVGDSLEKSGKVLRQFDVTVTVSRISGTGADVILKIETTIPADKNRVLYEHFPLPRSSEYKIDTESNRITEVLTTSWSNGDKSKEAEESVLTFKICTSKLKGETKEFPCQ